MEAFGVMGDENGCGYGFKHGSQFLRPLVFATLALTQRTFRICTLCYVHGENCKLPRLRAIDKDLIIFFQCGRIVLKVGGASGERHIAEFLNPVWFRLRQNLQDTFADQVGPLEAG